MAEGAAGKAVEPRRRRLAETIARRFVWPVGLSARLLVFTVAFVLGAQLLILPPTLAAFEEGWLTDRVRLAEVASVAVDVAPAGVVPSRMAGELLTGAGVRSVALQAQGVRRLLLRAPRMSRAPELIDLRSQSLAGWLAAPFRTLGPNAPSTLRIVAKPQFRGGDFVEIVVPAAPLQAALKNYLLRLLAVGVFTSAVAGGFVYVSLAFFLVRPVRRITLAMERFRARPQDPAARLKLSHRRDEIGRAEAELDRMQEDLLAALQSRGRLAALGEAVAMISHDLRNMLTSAQMASDRLAASGDPKVAQAMPRLERALDRSLRLAQGVLAYGRSEEPAPLPEPVPLRAAAEAAAEDAGLDPEGVRLETDVAPDALVRADPDQLHRILVNLLRNAREAIEHAGKTTGVVRLSLAHEPGRARVRIADTGPGVPERVRARLFQPFAGSARPEGTGLGLAIARDLARGHGGDLVLAESGPSGATFELSLPEPAP